MLIKLKIIFYCLLVCACMTPAFAQAQDNEQFQLALEYYNKGELEKARNVMEDLAGKRQNIPLIHDSYFDILLKSKAYKDAEKYISKVVRQFPDNMLYRIDEGRLISIQGDKQRAAGIFKDIIDEVKHDEYRTRLAAQSFFNHSLTDFAIDAYLEARNASGRADAFSIELANVYRLVNEKDKMIQEYLNFMDQNPGNVNYVKNVLQNLLTEEEDLVSLENVLYELVQKEPDKAMYSDLLIWVNLQRKNFFGAFVQARAYDKRLKKGGSPVMEIGIIALQNKDYANAVKAFNYIIKAYPEGLNYELARRFLIKSREELVKNTFPVDTADIKELIRDYDQLMADVGFTPTTLEAVRSEALLYAFYLDEKEKAIQLLKKVISSTRSGDQLRAKAKLDLGDIYLLMGQPWESTLLYSQVEKAQNEQPLGYEAKLKNAKLSYYKGDFALAEAHLDVLKMATTREIANNAIDLSLLIKDNTMLDTTHVAMKKYAAVELLLFQNKTGPALDSLNTLLRDYPGHRLTDEIYWLQADIYLKQGAFPKAISLLEKIVSEYNEDILSDDAYFLIGAIYDRQMQEKEKAMEIYRSFLTKYPGSIFTAEARKRFRELRGDFVN